MKVLVLQVNIGHGSYTYGGETSYSELFQKHCIPTVERWAEKYSYDYQQVTDMPEGLKEFDLSFHSHNVNKPKYYTFVRYYLMNQKKYDIIVSLDTDIFIPKSANPIPVTEGFWGVSHKLIPHPGINGGVQIIDKKLGCELSEYVMEKVRKKQRPKVMPSSDQGYVYQFRVDKSIETTLPRSWNYMVSDDNDFPKYIGYENNVDIIHYGGRKGRVHFLEDLKNGVVK